MLSQIVSFFLNLDNSLTVFDLCVLELFALLAPDLVVCFLKLHKLAARLRGFSKSQLFGVK